MSEHPDNHGPTLREARQRIATIGDHYGHGWIAACDRQRLRERILQLPRRVEWLGGQQTSYVQLDNILALLRE